MKNKNFEILTMQEYYTSHQITFHRQIFIHLSQYFLYNYGIQSPNSPGAQPSSYIIFNNGQSNEIHFPRKIKGGVTQGLLKGTHKRAQLTQFLYTIYSVYSDKRNWFRELQHHSISLIATLKFSESYITK